MTVEHILSDKGHAVVTIERDQTLGEAARLLAGRKIGAVVVSDGGGRVHGILSERDIVRALAEHGAAATEMKVGDRMTERVITCTPRSAIHDVMEMMSQGKFRHVPVVENDRLAGLVSIGDIVKHRLAEIEAEHKAMRDYIATA